MYEDQTRPYSPQAARVSHHIFRHGSPRLAIFAAIAGLLALAVSAASITLLLSYRATATAQIRLLQQAVANAQQGNQTNVSGLSSQAAKISAVNAALSALAPYSKICATDLNGPAGPAQFYFLCTDQKPGG
jgi:hypothetical protein